MTGFNNDPNSIPYDALAGRRMAHNLCKEHVLPRELGLSLPELVIVVAILGIVAVVAIPNLSSTDPQKLDLAAEIQAEAMRYARTEAMRRGEPIGFRQQNTQQRMRVYSLDTGTSPWTVVYDVYHPISKQLWDIRLDNHYFAAADDVSTTKLFRGTCNTPANIYFDAHGIARCADPETVLVEHYDVILTLGNHTRTVSLQGVTGRVTVQ